MKGVSEVLTTVIMIAIVLTVGLTIAYFAITTISGAISMASYELSVSAYTTLISNYDLIVNGGTYMVDFPERDIGLGYNLTGKRFKVVMYNGTHYITLINDTTIYELFVKGPSTVGNRESLLYGTGGLIVESPTYLPILVEHYIPGIGQYIIFNTTRISVFTASYMSGTSNITIIYILYSDLLPTVYGGATTKRLMLALTSMKLNETEPMEIDALTTVTINATLYDSNGNKLQTESRTIIVKNTTLKIYCRTLNVSAVIS